MRPLLPLTLLLAVPLVGPAHAKRPDAPTVPKVPAIEEVVAAEGFVPTPSQSEIYKPGAVLVPNGRGGHDVVVEACIDVEPSISIMSQSSIATTLAGGVSARLGVARGAGNAGVEKRLSFVDPEQRTISLGKLKPTDACTEEVKTAAAYQNLSEAIVLHDVLVAIIKNTVCTKANASGAVVALGAAEASAYSECVQESDGQVPLGYKAVPLTKALALAGVTATVPTAPPPTLVVPPSTPSAASASVDFGGMGSVDVDARLEAQACEQAAQRDGAAARQARLDAAALEVQAQASTAWRGMKASLRKCTQLPRADRADCIAMAEKWLGAARSMRVSLDAGMETVETDCGARQPAFAAASQQVSAQEVAAAEALLRKLKAADAVAQGFGEAPVSSGSFGTQGTKARVGDWTIAFPTNSHNAAIYRDSGNLAVEVIAGSVGWFHLRVDDRECTYHTSGGCDLKTTSVFYARPYTSADRGERVTSRMQVTLADPSFKTQRSTIYVEPTSIRVKLNDGGNLSFEANARTIRYISAAGETTLLP